MMSNNYSDSGRRTAATGRQLVAAALMLSTVLSFGCASALEITTQTLPVASVNAAYSFQLQARHSDNQWSLIQGTLPPGIGLSQRGMLSGAPDQAGVFNFTVQVVRTNDFGRPTSSVSQGLSLIVQ